MSFLNCRQPGYYFLGEFFFFIKSINKLDGLMHVFYEARPMCLTKVFCPFYFIRIDIELFELEFIGVNLDPEPVLDQRIFLVS